MPAPALRVLDYIMRQIEVSAGEGRYQILITALFTDGNGVCVFMTGGERPHIGASVVALSGSGTAEPDSQSLWTISLPAHKDSDIAIPVAQYLAGQFGQTVALTAGIHIDHATKDEIQLLCSNCLKAAERLAAAAADQNRNHVDKSR